MYSKIRLYLLKNADQNNENSVSRIHREKRHRLFLNFCSEFESPVKVIDLGGSDYYWKNLPGAEIERFRITIVNKDDQSEGLNINFIKHDVRDLSFIKDKEFDIVFSNSLIEHISNDEELKKLADEIRRIGKKYFIQTPNYYFPVEPHFLFPFFQFLPENIKVNLAMKHSLGWFEKQTDIDKAKEIVNSVRLLKEKELRVLFPGCKIYKEKYFLLNKSFIVFN